MSYSEKMKTLATSAIGNVRKYNEAIQKAENDCMIYGGAEVYKTALAKVRTEKDDYVKSMNETAKRYYAEYVEAVKAYFLPDGTKLTDDANILKCGLVMTAGDIQGMFERYNGNVTMQRLIAQYAAVHSMEMTAAMQKAAVDINVQMNPYIEAGKNLVVYFDNALHDAMYADLWTTDGYFQKISAGILDV